MLQKFSKIPRWIKIAVPIVLILVIIIYFVVGWIFSTKLIVRENQKVEFDQKIVSIEADVYTISGSTYDIDGVVGGIKADGTYFGLFSAPISSDKASKTAKRTLTAANTQMPKPGDQISVQGNIWASNPKEALGLDYEDIKYMSPVGSLGAWYVPAETPSTKWTIAVHGIGANKQEMLRFIKPVHAAGNNVMVINYRGDDGNPAQPKGYVRFGDTEWKDLEAAVRYAKSKGATDIQLYGSSLGGSITQNYLRRSDDVNTTNITKVILDSPALNWNEILVSQAKRSGYPGFVTIPGKTVASLRAGINFNRITTKPGSITKPTLIIHNTDDLTIPVAGSERVANAQPDLVTFENFQSGGHIRAWNHDRARYEALVTGFLK